MSIDVIPVRNRKMMKKFIRLPYRLYGNDPNWVPPLIRQEKAHFDEKVNPAFRYCRTRFFLAVENGRTVGRVAAIVNERYLEKTGRKCGRFGWFECEENGKAAEMLLSSMEEWLAGMGMNEVSGPMGFTDNDTTGFLVQGFDELPTIAGSYTPSWYNELVTGLGYSKEVDYVEYRIKVPENIPERLERLASLVARRSRVRVFNEKSSRAMSRKWGRQIFEVLNEAYGDLYGTTVLDDDEVDYYINAYLGQVDPEFIKLAVSDDRLVGFIIAMPNLSRAFRKARGRLLPVGFIHILREMKTSRVLDFYLAGIRPEYRGKGIDVLMSFEMIKSAMNRGIEFAESNHELEDNKKIRAMWKEYDKRLHKRVRVYNKQLRR